MRKEALLGGVFLVVASALLLVYAPDTITFLFVVLMCIIMTAGYFAGIYAVSNYSKAFKNGRQALNHSRNVETSDLWLVVEQKHSFFGYAPLDKVFNEYRVKIQVDKKSDQKILTSVESYISEGSISLSTWRGVVNQIPNTMTGIGILGTFVGLVIGVGNIGFSSVSVAMSSLQTLISGIEIAFYTSIAGVIFSILFNLFYKLTWNMMLREMKLFFAEFHKYVIPTEEEQVRQLQCMMYREEAEHRKKTEEFLSGLMNRTTRA